MEPTYNEYGSTSTEPPSFKVHGHDVTILDDFHVQVIIHCNWVLTQEITWEQKTFVTKQTEKVIKYLWNEGLVDNNKKLGVFVETRHSQTEQ